MSWSSMIIPWVVRQLYFQLKIYKLALTFRDSLREFMWVWFMWLCHWNPSILWDDRGLSVSSLYRLRARSFAEMNSPKQRPLAGFCEVSRKPAAGRVLMSSHSQSGSGLTFPLLLTNSVSHGTPLIAGFLVSLMYRNVPHREHIVHI